MQAEAPKIRSDATFRAKDDATLSSSMPVPSMSRKTDLHASTLARMPSIDRLSSVSCGHNDLILITLKILVTYADLLDESSTIASAKTWSVEARTLLIATKRSCSGAAAKFSVCTSIGFEATYQLKFLRASGRAAPYPDVIGRML